MVRPVDVDTADSFHSEVLGEPSRPVVVYFWSSTCPACAMLSPQLDAAGEPSVQSDIYALGVVLYQLVVGDFGRPLGQGWEREIEDELLREDIATCVQGLPERRLASAGELAERLFVKHDAMTLRRAATYTTAQLV